MKFVEIQRSIKAHLKHKINRKENYMKLAKKINGNENNAKLA
jgi:hypothetical protein